MAVPRFAAGAVELLVPVLRGPWLRRQRSDDEARILALFQELRFGDQTAGARPTLVGSVGELREDAGCPLGGLVQLAGPVHLGADDPAQPLVAFQAGDIIDLVLFALFHQFFATEAGVGSLHDLHLGPALADLSQDGPTSLTDPALPSWSYGRRRTRSNWSPAKISGETRRYLGRCSDAVCDDRKPWRYDWIRFCNGAGGELEQIQFLLGHASVQTTERYWVQAEIQRCGRRSIPEIAAKPTAIIRCISVSGGGPPAAETLRRNARRRQAMICARVMVRKAK
jgi:hypothetical protein